MELPSVPDTIDKKTFFAKRCNTCFHVRSVVLDKEPTTPIALFCGAPQGTRFIDTDKTITAPTGSLVDRSNFCALWQRRNRR